VIEDIRSGELDLDRDLAWIDGMGDKWETLGFVLELYCLPNRETPPFSVQDIFSPPPEAPLERPVLVEATSGSPGLAFGEPVPAHEENTDRIPPWLVPSLCATIFGVLAVMAFVFYPYAEMEQAARAIGEIKKHGNNAKALTDAIEVTFRAQVALSALLWALMGFAAVPLASVFRLQNRGWDSVTTYVVITLALTVACHYWRYLESSEIIRLLPVLSGNHVDQETKMALLKTTGLILATYAVEPVLSLLAAFAIFRRPAMWVVIFWFTAGFLNGMFYILISMACGFPDFMDGYRQSFGK
jgi:hypothetical protein